MSAYTIAYHVFGGLIFLVLLIGMPLVNKGVKEKAKSYENGLKIRYDCAGIKDNYNLQYNSKEEPSREDIIDLFKKLEVPVKEFTEKHIIIPWEEVTTWKFDHAVISYVTHAHSISMIRFKLKKLSSDLVIGPLSSFYKQDEVYVAFKEYAGDKETDSYKTPKWAIIAVVVFILAVILGVYM